MAEVIRGTLDEFIECSVCREVYKDPRSLPCLHTFCFICCEGFCRDKHPGDDVECPLCREPFVIPPSSVVGLRKNFVIEALKQINNPSTSHQEGNTELHGLRMSVPSFCDKHTNRTLDLFCVDCKQAACTSCKTKLHNPHRVVDVDDVVKDLRATLTSDVTALSRVYKKCELSLKKIDNEEKQLIKNVQRVEAEITREAKRLQELIERQKSELLAEVSARKRNRLKEVENLKQELRQQLASVNSLMSYTTELANNGSAGEIAREANSLGKRASRVLDAQMDGTTDDSKLGSYRLAYAPRNEQVLAIGHLTESTEQLEVKLIRSLPVQQRWISGLTTLDKQLYVIDNPPHIAVLNPDTFDVQRLLSVPGLSSVTDMTSCPRHRCLYLANKNDNVVQRVEVKTTDTDDKFSKWNVHDEPWSLSVNADYNVIVTCWKVNKIKVFTTFGQLQTAIDLHDVVHPLHAIQLTPDQFIVCHASRVESDAVHRVCLVDCRGNVRKSFGSSPGSDEDHVSGSGRLAAVNGFIFVADLNNQRVMMLSPTLRYIQTVASELSGYPLRMCFDEQTDRLYIGENKCENEKLTSGHVNAYSAASTLTED